MKKAKVVVMGSFVVDLMMRASRLPVPGETIKGKQFDIGAGGKGSNQGVSAAKAGAEVTMITKIGNDEFAALALDSFSKNGIGTEFVFVDKNNSTGAALIMVDENTSQNKIIVTIGACDNITDSDIEQARKEIEKADIFLTQLETNQTAVIKSMEIAKKAAVKIILNPAPAEEFDEKYFSMIDYFTPNETEAEFYSKIKIETEDDAKRAAEFFLAKGVKNCIITLGKKGALLYSKEKSKLFPPFKVKAVDTTGAGDAFNGGLATALAEGKEIEQAIIFANAVASLSVTKIGTAKAMPNRKEINKIIHTNQRDFDHL